MKIKIEKSEKKSVSHFRNNPTYPFLSTIEQIFKNFQYILPWQPNLPNNSEITKFMGAFIVLVMYVELFDSTQLLWILLR